MQTINLAPLPLPLPLPLTTIFRRCDILNRGYSGYTSRMILDILPQLVTREEARDIVAVTILLGTNDAVSKKKRPMVHVPVPEYQENMKGIIQYLQVFMQYLQVYMQYLQVYYTVLAGI